MSAASRLELSLVATGFAYRRSAAPGRRPGSPGLLGRVRDIRRAGAASLDLCTVAAGWLDGYFEHGLHRWDWAGGALVAEEAGAVVRLPASADDMTFVATPGIADELTQVARRDGPGRI